MIMAQLYSLDIQESNRQPHIDIEREVLNHKGTLLHFEIRYNNGKIVDLVVREYEEYKTNNR